MTSAYHQRRAYYAHALLARLQDAFFYALSLSVQHSGTTEVDLLRPPDGMVIFICAFWTLNDAVRTARFGASPRFRFLARPIADGPDGQGAVAIADAQRHQCLCRPLFPRYRGLLWGCTPHSKHWLSDIAASPLPAPSHCTRRAAQTNLQELSVGEHLGHGELPPVVPSHTRLCASSPSAESHIRLTQGISVSAVELLLTLLFSRSPRLRVRSSWSQYQTRLRLHGLGAHVAGLRNGLCPVFTP